MIELLVSNQSQDAVFADRLAAALARKGFRMKTVPGGQDWRRQRAADIDTASLLVVVWSEASAGPEGALVREEAERALKRGILLAVRAGKAQPPLGFGEVPTFDLRGWGGSAGSRNFKLLLAAAGAVCVGQPVPRSAPVPAWRRWLLGLGPLLLGAYGFAADSFGLQGLLCRLPGIHKACGAWQLGGVPTPAEQASWEAIRAGDCESLREHLSLFPNGIYAAEADRRYDARKTYRVEAWSPRAQDLAIFVPASTTPWPTEAKARDAVFEAARKESLGACAAFEQSGLHRVRNVSVIEPTFDCRALMGGTTCAFKGKAACKLDELKVRELLQCL